MSICRTMMMVVVMVRTWAWVMRSMRSVRRMVWMIWIIRIWLVWIWSIWGIWIISRIWTKWVYPEWVVPRVVPNATPRIPYKPRVVIPWAVPICIA